MLYVECKADEALASRLGLTRKEINHELNKDEVLQRLMEGVDRRGMVDEDPNSTVPVQFGQMLKSADHSQLGITLYTNTSRNNLAIVLQPDLEGWIIRTAFETQTRLNDPRYGLPVDKKHLHDVVNKKLDKFRLLIDDLLSAQSPRLLRLQTLLIQ